MATDDGITDETLADAEAQLPDDHPVLKALRSERKLREAAQREAENLKTQAERATKFGELRSRFPFLTEAHEKFLGPEVGEWEARAEELHELRGQPAEPAGHDQEPAPESPVAPRPEEATFSKVAALGPARSGPPEAQTYSPSEIREIGIRDQAKALQLIQEGRMKSP